MQCAGNTFSQEPGATLSRNEFQLVAIWISEQDLGWSFGLLFRGKRSSRDLHAVWPTAPVTADAGTHALPRCLAGLPMPAEYLQRNFHRSPIALPESPKMYARLSPGPLPARLLGNIQGPDCHNQRRHPRLGSGGVVRYPSRKSETVTRSARWRQLNQEQIVIFESTAVTNRPDESGHSARSRPVRNKAISS